MSKKGFTLIELLVVVAVLALLASIVFSNLGGAREGARISNALSFQSQTHSLLGSDLVGWWNFNEGDARDISGYDNHGNIVGATHVDGVPGTGGSALSFNGTSNRVDLGSGTVQKTIHGAPAVTITAWINQSELIEQSKTIIGIPIHTTLGGSNIYVGNSGYFITGGRSQSGDSFQSLSSTIAVISPGTWYCVTGVLDYRSKRMELFVDGISVGNATGISFGLNYFNAGSNGDSRIGMTPHVSAERYFNGLIDDVRIYSRALTASEIQTLYAQTKDNYLANE